MHEVGIGPIRGLRPLNFESENRFFANPMILKAVSLNPLKYFGKSFQADSILLCLFQSIRVEFITILSHSQFIVCDRFRMGKRCPSMPEKQ